MSDERELNELREVLATVRCTMLTLSAIEREMLDRHSGSDHRVLMVLLHQEIVAAMLHRLLEKHRRHAGTELANVAKDIAAKAMIVEGDIDAEPS